MLLRKIYTYRQDKEEFNKYSTKRKNVSHEVTKRMTGPVKVLHVFVMEQHKARVRSLSQSGKKSDIVHLICVKILPYARIKEKISVFLECSSSSLILE